jgi:3-hydroxyacyl-CoA dehydrogenase
MGLVEVGAGLIPAAGGCKELLHRHTEGFSASDDLTPPTRTAFERIGMAKVASSAEEAREWRFLRPSDEITMNRDRLIADAQQAALQMAKADAPPKTDMQILAGGNAVLAVLQLELYLMREAKYISDYDVHIGRKLAHVLSGGPLSQPGLVSEEYLLGLEKEAFLGLCGEEKTQQRMEHILTTGKPLRN